MYLNILRKQKKKSKAHFKITYVGRSVLQHSVTLVFAPSTGEVSVNQGENRRLIQTVKGLLSVMCLLKSLSKSRATPHTGHAHDTRHSCTQKTKDLMLSGVKRTAAQWLEAFWLWSVLCSVRVL